METVMAKGFIRLTRIYLRESMFIKASLISAVIPLKTMVGYDDTTEGSAVYCIADKMFEKENYICVLESSEKVMGLMKEAEEFIETIELISQYMKGMKEGDGDA